MKKNLLSATVLMLFSLTTQSQEIKFGIKAGANFSNIGGDMPNTDMKTGFNAGIFVEFMLTDRLSVQPEIVYSMQGYKSTYETDYHYGYISEYEVKYDYLNVPVMLKYYITEGLSLHAGPQVGFLLSEKYDIGSEEGSSENMETVDVGVAGGVEYDLPIGLFFQARYYTGLININKDVEYSYYGYFYEGTYINNNVVSLSVGYKF